MNERKIPKHQMTTDREYLACLLCTAQGVPMVTRIFRGETARTIGYWKSVSQYICLSAGLWKSTANWHSFLISNDSTTLYVISFVWCGHIIFCCIDMVTEHESVAQPFLLAHYIIHHFCRITSKRDIGPGKSMLLQLLEDIEILSHQQSEGTFADTVGDNEDGGWEKYLDDHTIRDDIIDFEEFLRTDEYVLEVASKSVFSSSLWPIKTFPSEILKINSEIRIFIISGSGSPFGAIALSDSSMTRIGMESWYRDELCELAQQTIQKSTSNESAVIHFRDKFGVGELALVITNIVNFAQSLAIDQQILLVKENPLKLLNSSKILFWVDEVDTAYNSFYSNK